MYVFVAHVPGMDRESFPMADHLEDSFQFLFDILVCQDLSTILGGPNQVVLAGIGTMTLCLVETSIGH
jgi:hypothetical protein